MTFNSVLQTTSVRWYNACAYYSVFTSVSLEKLGLNIVYASDENSPPYTQAAANGLKTAAVNFSSFVPHTFYAQLRKLDAIAKNEKIQLINCHRPEDHLFAGLVGKRLGIPVVRTVGDIRPPRENIFNHWLHVEATDFFIFSCEMNRARYVSLWPEIEEQSAIILGGVDTDTFSKSDNTSELLKKYNLPAGVPLIGLIGRLSRNKDIPTFVRSAKLVKEAVPDAKFVISGQEFSVKVSELKKIAAELDIENDIIFIDRVDTVSELINLLTVGVIASKESEAICRIGMEYIACGVPVVATDVNVLPEVVRAGHNGFIALRQNAHDMAVHIVRLLRDRNLIRQIQKNNRTDAKQRFSHKVVAEQTIAAYAQAVDYFKTRSKN